MSSNEQLLQQIDDLVASKTFNLDAIEVIKKIKDDLRKTLEERDKLQRRYDDLYEDNKRCKGDVTERDLVIDTLQKQLTESKALNATGQKAIYEAEKHKAVAEAWQGAMAMVFKPNTVRETIARSVMKPVEGHPGGNGSYPTAGYLANGTESETITREDA